MHSVFNVDLNMINLFFAEMVWCKKHGNSYSINKDAVEIMREKLDDRDSFDASACDVGGVRNVCFIKNGNMTTWERTMCKD